MLRTARRSQEPPRPAAEVDVEAMRRLGRVCEVLEAARTVIARGWMQDGWYTVAPTGERLRGLRMLLADRSPDPAEVASACLVAAVAVAAHRPGARVDVIRDAGPALDVVWEALEESSGRAGRAGRAVPREVRVARMRELARWNDTPGRARAEVLALLDRSISHTITSALGRSASG